MKMSSDLTRTVHVPLSQYTIGELRLGAAKLREMAATARTVADIRALEALGRRFDALADRRDVEDHEASKAAETLAFRLSADDRLGTAGDLPTLGADTPMGAPSPEASLLASEAICRHYAYPETSRHPEVRAASAELSYDLMAYAMAPPKAERQAPRS